MNGLKHLIFIGLFVITTGVVFALPSTALFAVTITVCRCLVFIGKMI